MISSKKEVHFFHGFLGRPNDWDATLSFLSKDLKSVPVFKHDLLKDCEPLESLNFESWRLEMESVWGSLVSSRLPETPERILVGYSLGGRLCLHLNPELYSQLFLIAAHPGLKSGFAEREKQDDAWANSLLKEDPEKWLQRWNNQLVFGQDRVRPKRSIQGEQKKWAEILKCFSLARQKNCDQKIQSNKHKIYWIVGEKDLKFQSLKEPMKSFLGEDHVIEIRDAGHGVLFDQPELLAQALQERF